MISKTSSNNDSVSKNRNQFRIHIVSVTVDSRYKGKAISRRTNNKSRREKKRRVGRGGRAMGLSKGADTHTFY